MKILVSFLLLISFKAFSKCQFKDGTKRIYSLSGPVTKVIEELGLVHELAGISVYYPKVEKFKGEIIPGGVFLSPMKLREMKGALVFYDQVQELRKVFNTGIVEAYEFSARGKSPQVVTEDAYKVLLPHLKNCSYGPIKEKIKSLEKKIKSSMKEKRKIVFFLGEVSPEKKLPELVIVNDGLVKWLKDESLIETYPTELAYVNWSGKQMEKMKSFIFLGLKEGSPKVEGKDLRQTLTYPGALVPGLFQIEAWDFYLSSRRSL